jgi:hypothetical protein
MPQLLAIFAPFGAIILLLLLALAVSHAAVYALLYSCLGSRHRRKTAAGPETLTTVVKRVSMLGLHIQDEPGEKMGRSTTQWAVVLSRSVSPQQALTVVSLPRSSYSPRNLHHDFATSSV